MWKQRLSWMLIGALGAIPVMKIWTHHIDPILVVKVVGGSMEPTLHEKEVWLCVPTAHYRYGDVVVLKSPTSAHSIFVKRIVGLPGDVVVSDRLHSPATGGLPGVVWIPEGHVWVEGDNALKSNDSNAFGPVPMAALIGRLTCRFYPTLSFTPPDPHPVPSHRVLTSPLPAPLINYWRARNYLPLPAERLHPSWVRSRLTE
jgi:signal peptidase I